MSNARWEKFDGLRHKVGEAVAAINRCRKPNASMSAFWSSNSFPPWG